MGKSTLQNKYSTVQVPLQLMVKQLAPKSVVEVEVIHSYKNQGKTSLGKNSLMDEPLCLPAFHTFLVFFLLIQHWSQLLK